MYVEDLRFVDALCKAAAAANRADLLPVHIAVSTRAVKLPAPPPFVLLNCMPFMQVHTALNPSSRSGSDKGFELKAE